MTTITLCGIPRGERPVCCARLMDGSARYCRRLATVQIMTDRFDSQTQKPYTLSPVCGHHRDRVMAEIREIVA